MPVETSLSSDASVLNIVLSGEFDINRSLQIQEMIESFPDSVRLIRMDLEKVTRIDSTIFSTLILLYFEKEKKARIELINCQKSLAQRLSMAGLDRFITIRMSLSKTEAGSTDIEETTSSKDRR